jgi:hypothetical protein
MSGSWSKTSETNPQIYSPITTIATGSNHTCVLSLAPTFITNPSKVAGFAGGYSKNQIWCWGDNSSGQLGSLSASVKSTAEPQSLSLPTTATITQIAAGGKHTCATDNQKIWCWGDNTSGQLGQNCNAASCSTPQLVSFPDTKSPLPKEMCLTNSLLPAGCNLPFYNAPPSNPSQILISAGSQHSCATFTTNGPNNSPISSVYCWGANSFHELGNAVPSPMSASAVSVLSQ